MIKDIHQPNDLKAIINAFYEDADHDLYGSLCYTLCMVCEELYFNRKEYDLTNKVDFRPKCGQGVSLEVQDSHFYQNWIKSADTALLTKFGEWLNEKIDKL